MDFRFEVMMYSNLEKKNSDAGHISTVHGRYILLQCCRFPIPDLITARFSIYIFLLWIGITSPDNFWYVRNVINM